MPTHIDTHSDPTRIPLTGEALLCQAADLPVTDGADSVPDWIHLIPAGKISTVDGRGPYRLQSAEAVVSAFSGRAPVDENHATDLAAPLGQSSPARGWIVALEARQDGIWGRVDWTGSGRALLADRAYRHISPVITVDETGGVTGLLRASLTNRPNFRGLTALNSASAGVTMKSIATLLGLAETASEADVSAAIADLKGQVTLHQAAMDKVARSAGLQAGAEGDAICQAVQAARDPGQFVPRAQVAELQAQLADVQTRLDAQTVAAARKAAEVVVDGAIADGRVGIKPLRDHYVTRHMADPDAVQKEIAAMPVLKGSLPGITAPRSASGKTAKEIADAALLHMEEQRKAGVIISHDEALAAVS